MHLDKHTHLIVGLVLKLGKISILIGDCYINNISHFIMHVQVCKGLWRRSCGLHLACHFEHLLCFLSLSERKSAL